jgi:hypothetical protein
MIRRGFALLVAVLVIAAPVAAQICGAACSERLGHASHSSPIALDHSAQQHDHSAHLTGQSGRGAATRLLPRPCSEPYAVVNSSRDPASQSGPALGSSVRLPTDARSAASFDADARRSPPRPIRSISLLRI